MENAPRVLRIDSRFRTSGTSTTFTYELNESMQFPEGTRAIVTGVTMPYSWWNIDAGVNDNLYVLESTTDGCHHHGDHQAIHNQRGMGTNHHDLPDPIYIDTLK